MSPRTPRTSFDRSSRISLVCSMRWVVLDHVVDSTNFFAGDFQEVYPLFQEVRKEVFAGRLPASTSIGVAKLLLPTCHVEEKLTAAVPE